MKIKLIDFDQDFFDSLSDKDAIHPSSSGKCYYHSLFVDGQRAGIVGFTEPRIVPEEKRNIKLGLIQIILLPDYRGKD